MSEATSAHDIRQIAHGEHSNPFSVLGLHRIRANGTEAAVLRAFVPWAKQLSALFEGSDEPVALERIHPSGFFAAVVPREAGRDSAQWVAELRRGVQVELAGELAPDEVGVLGQEQDALAGGQADDLGRFHTIQASSWESNTKTGAGMPGGPERSGAAFYHRAHPSGRHLLYPYPPCA